MLTGRVRQFLLALFLLIISVSLHAVSLKPDAPERYEVKRGDSLWSIAAQYLQDPWMWPQLWQANSQVEDPHKLYPGDVIYLLEGENFLRLEPRLRIMTLQAPIPFMPLEKVEAYLNRDIMVDRPEFEDSLYISRIEGGRSLGSQGNQLEVLGDLTPDVKRYGIYRDIEEIRDPLTRRVLGHMARAVGAARLIRDEEGYAATLEITDNYEEIRVGDRLMPFDSSPFDEGFNPAPPKEPVTGLVVRSLKPGQTRIEQYQPVMLNQGHEELKPGDLLQVLEPGKRRRDPRNGEVIFAGENPRGLVMVYRVFDKTSFGLVMNSNQPLYPEDTFRRAPDLIP
ncbi:LysM domain-containing protein [Marinospirillum sp.]|uniref:LysM peptidoglycan-binding domain-containing protein n=1 Tax=Marinospirillum sp. TaxID=2183934 RepID=UPI0028702E40|nr:LysM domain-containing protein [Marinospirillum sp.]MDR9468552.1 LysM domain-containing protein [Marinospirillum sp.]